MSAVDTDDFRAKLLEERQRVLDAIDYLHHENPGSIEDETEESPIDNHLAENATVTLDRQIDYTLEENSAQVLAAIDGALDRIDAGTFGICRTCATPIPFDRLEAIPWTTQCIDCKRKEERG